MRTGDTASRDRQRLVRRPPDLLITTPESLYLMLTSSAAETLVGVETVIVDEIHALAPTKRGAHLALSLERLEEITARPPQRIGLSATQRPLEEVARFLGGWAAPGEPRPVTIVDAGIRKPLEVEVVIPVEDMGDLGREPGRRRAAARTGQRGDVAPARAASGRASTRASSTRSSSTAPRSSSATPAARPSASPPSSTSWPRSAASASTPRPARLARGAGQGPPRLAGPRAAHHRRGRAQAGRPAGHRRHQQPRAGHRHGRRRPRHPGRVAGRGQPRPAAHRPGRSPGRRAEQGLDLPQAPRRPARGGRRRAADARRPDRVDPLPAQPARRAGPADRRPRRPQAGETPVAELAALVRRCANFAELSDEQFANTLDLLAGRYPSEEFSELRPRVVWNRVNDTRAGPRRVEAAGRHVRRHDPRPRPVRRVPARRHAGRRARRGDGLREPARRDVRARRVDVADRGHHVPEGHRHAGARRAGEDAVLARRPAGPPARAGPGARRVRARAARAAAGQGHARCCASDYALDELAAANLLQYVDEQAEATGVVPDDRTIVVERFRDEIGDWRVCVLSPFGTPVHAPWAMAIERRLTDRYDMPVESMWGDDGIVLRLPEAADELPLDAVMIDPEDIEEIVVADAAADGAVLVAVPGVRRAGPAAAAPPTRPAHAAVAAAPEGGRPAGRGRQVPDVPDPAGGVAGVPAGRVRRAGAARGARPAAQPGRAHRHRRHGQAEPDGPEPAVQLDRRLHVRGRRPAGRAAGRRAGARPRPAARPARRRGAARAARPRRARRRRARPAAPLRRSPGPQRRRAARRAAPGR